MGRRADRFVVHHHAGLLGVRVLAALITVATLGFGFPVGLVMVRRRRARHSTYDGRSVEFTGSARELFRDWLPWWMLTLGTLGVYAAWAFPRVARWVREHTRVAPLPLWEYDVGAVEPPRPLAAPTRLAPPFFAEAGLRPLAG